MSGAGDGGPLARMTSGRPRAALYARVSTRDKNQAPETQLQPLRDWAARLEYDDREYVDHASGRDLNRPVWKRLEADWRRGQVKVVAVVCLDRAFHSIMDMYQTFAEWEGRGIRFVALTQPVDTGTPVGKLLTTVLGAVAEFESDLTRERVREGLARIRRDGKHVGRPRRRLGRLRAQMAVRECGSIRAAARFLGVSESTLRRRLSKG